MSVYVSDEIPLPPGLLGETTLYKIDVISEEQFNRALRSTDFESAVRQEVMVYFLMTLLDLEVTLSRKPVLLRRGDTLYVVRSSWDDDSKKVKTNYYRLSIADPTKAAMSPS